VRALRIALVVGLAITGGAVVGAGAASASKANRVEMIYSGSTGMYWENYVRSHTDKSDIVFDMNESESDFKGGDVALKYESNEKVFASSTVGNGPVLLAKNWGPTRFRFGFHGGIATGKMVATLTY